MTLELRGVSVRYQRRAVFENVDLALAAGDVFGLIGPNGAGKTTLLRMAAGLIRPAAGAITRQGQVMYFGGESTLPGSCHADRWARLFGSRAQARRSIGRLSRGMRQMLGLSAFLARDDWSIGLLDEPWEGLDPAGSRWLTAAITRHRERGAGMLISSHRLHDVAQVCSAYGFLSQGVFRPVAAEQVGVAPGKLTADELSAMFDDLDR